jgi:exodeoxyribonuclease VII small subunit
MAKTSTSADANPMSFEQMLKELDEVVRALESGQLSLEDSLARFQKGVEVVKVAQGLLGQAEQRVEILTKAAQDKVESKPFQE